MQKKKGDFKLYVSRLFLSQLRAPAIRKFVNTRNIYDSINLTFALEHEYELAANFVGDIETLNTTPKLTIREEERHNFREKKKNSRKTTKFSQWPTKEFPQEFIQRYRNMSIVDDSFLNDLEDDFDLEEIEEEIKNVNEKNNIVESVLDDVIQLKKWEKNNFDNEEEEEEKDEEKVLENGVENDKRKEILNVDQSNDEILIDDDYDNNFDTADDDLMITEENNNNNNNSIDSFLQNLNNLNNNNENVNTNHENNNKNINNNINNINNNENNILHEKNKNKNNIENNINNNENNNLNNFDEEKRENKKTYMTSVRSIHLNRETPTPELYRKIMEGEIFDLVLDIFDRNFQQNFHISLEELKKQMLNQNDDQNQIRNGNKVIRKIKRYYDKQINIKGRSQLNNNINNINNNNINNSNINNSFNNSLINNNKNDSKINQSINFNYSFNNSILKTNNKNNNNNNNNNNENNEKEEKEKKRYEKEEFCRIISKIITEISEHLIKEMFYLRNYSIYPDEVQSNFRNEMNSFFHLLSISDIPPQFVFILIKLFLFLFYFYSIF